MPRIGPHHHPCKRCGVKVECCGDLEQHGEAAWEWHCVEFDRFNGDVLCDACFEQQQQQAAADALENVSEVSVNRQQAQE